MTCIRITMAVSATLPEDVFRPYLRGKFYSDDRLSSYQGYGHFSWKQQYVWPSAHRMNCLNGWVTARALGEADTVFPGKGGKAMNGICSLPSSEQYQAESRFKPFTTGNLPTDDDQFHFRIFAKIPDRLPCSLGRAPGWK